MDKSFLTAFFVYGATTGLARILPILMLPIYLSQLGVNEYGSVEVVLAVFNLLLVFGLLQLETGLQRQYYSAENKADLFSAVILSVTCLSVVVALFACLFAEAISSLLFNNEEYASSIIYASLSVVFANIATICMVVLRYMDRPLWFASLSIGQAVVTASCTYYFIIYLALGSVGYFYGLLIGWFFLALSSFFLVYKSFGLTITYVYLRSVLSFSLPQFPARLASFFVQYANRFFVLSILGVQSVAIMSLSLKFAAAFQLMLLAFSMAWNPFIYKNENSPTLNRDINRIFGLLLVALAFFHVVISFSSGFVVDYFFGDEYGMAADYVSLAIIPFQLLIIKEIVESGVKLANKTHYISVAYILSALLSALLMSFSVTLEHIFWSSIIGVLVLVLLSWFFSEANSDLMYSKKTFFIYLFCVFVSGFDF